MSMNQNQQDSKQSEYSKLEINNKDGLPNYRFGRHAIEARAFMKNFVEEVVPKFDNILKKIEGTKKADVGNLNNELFGILKELKGQKPEVLKELRLTYKNDKGKLESVHYGDNDRGRQDWHVIEQEAVNYVANRLHKLKANKSNSLEYDYLCLMANSFSNMGAPLPDDHKRLYLEAVSYGAEANKKHNPNAKSYNPDKKIAPLEAARSVKRVISGFMKDAKRKAKIKLGLKSPDKNKNEKKKKPKASIGFFL